ncbi:uncharacterized protein LOC115989042 isoform X2 [Quercus lobata]|uniref:uncharacterized protein LOC115989042 isoform X2 n=1 Tax=Quercus lobata TaxID=97700 RepID=UPI00124511D0|nr:uncharacterized protein LOC115989042 isoform X2 [Quercus lobata]
MSNKKHNAPPSPSQPPPSSEVDDQSPSITDEVNRALSANHNGNPAEALSLLKSTLSRHPNSALAHSALSFIQLKVANLDSTAADADDDDDRLLQLEHVRSSVKSSKRAVELCPVSLSFWFFHVVALVKLAQYDSDAGFEAVIEACDTGLAIEHPTVVEERLKLDGEHEIESLRKQLRLVKLQSKYLVDAKSLGKIKDEIKELQDRKEEIEQRAITARKNLETPLSDTDNKRKLKNVKKVAANVDTVAARVKAYWNDRISMELKKDLLSVELLLQFANKDSPEAVAVVMQALEHVKAAKNWKFSTCCLCGERFFEVKLNADHMKSVHLGTLSDELRSVEPEIEFDSVHDTVKSRKWRPVEVVAAKEMMEDLSRNKRGDEGLEESEVFMNHKEWPYCEDTRRDLIIDKIRSRLRVYLKIRFFVSSHLSVFMDLIMEMLKKRIPEQLLKEHWMDRTVLTACFLDISELNRVYEFLDDLHNICGLQSLSVSLARDEVRGMPCVANHEKIVFNEDFSCVVFDKRMLRGELVVPNDGAAITSSADAETVLNDDECKDAIVDWLLGGTNISIGERLMQWTNFRETSKSQAMEFFKIYEAEFHRMQNFCEKKIEYLRDIKVWKNLESICVEEDKRREEISGYKPWSYEYLLLEQHKLIKRTDGDTFESDIIWNILKVDHVDNEIKLGIKKQIDELAEKLYKFDSIIRTTTIAMKQTGKKIDAVTSYDYRSIMVPLLKSFMQARLEDLANEDAEEKSKAAEKELLSELNLDDKKNSNKGGGNSTQGQGKSKVKKKKKDHRKAKEFKATGGSEEQQENVQQISFPAAHGGDDRPNPEIVDPVTTDELEQQERKLTSEVEKEQRMLKEHLEYQRQIENEVKQKRLAELNKAGSSAGNM